MHALQVHAGPFIINYSFLIINYLRKGLCSFSKPMVVAGPCPGYTFTASGNTNSF